jgi:hypothetical protein
MVGLPGLAQSSHAGGASNLLIDCAQRRGLHEPWYRLFAPEPYVADVALMAGIVLIVFGLHDRRGERQKS